MSTRKPRIAKGGPSAFQRLKDLPEADLEKLAGRAREVPAQTLIAEIRALHGISGLSPQRLSDFWRWLDGRRALRAMQEDAAQFRAEMAAAAGDGPAPTPTEIHVATVNYLRMKGLREDDDKLLLNAVKEARRAIALEQDARKLALLEERAAKAKETLTKAVAKGGITPATRKLIEEAMSGLSS